MNKWKISFFITLLILIGSNIFWFFKLVDIGIAFSYHQDSYNQKASSLETLGSLIVEGSEEYTKKDILHLLRQAKPEAFIVEEENVIIIEQIEFIFQNNELREIKG